MESFYYYYHTLKYKLKNIVRGKTYNFVYLKDVPWFTWNDVDGRMENAIQTLFFSYIEKELLRDYSKDYPDQLFSKYPPTEKYIVSHYLFDDDDEKLNMYGPATYLNKEGIDYSIDAIHERLFHAYWFFKYELSRLKKQLSDLYDSYTLVEQNLEIKEENKKIFTQVRDLETKIEESSTEHYINIIKYRRHLWT